MSTHERGLLLALALGAACIAPGSESENPEATGEQEIVEEIPLIEGNHNIIRNSDFEEGGASPWIASTHGKAVGTARVENGAYCMDLQEPGLTAWDAQVRYRQLQVYQGHKYVVEFLAYASANTQVRAKIGSAGPPYDEYWAGIVDVTPEPQRFVGSFVMRSPHDLEAELTFQMAGPLVGPADGKVKICYDNIALSDPEFTPPPPPPKLPYVRVNQVGYHPRWAKHATVKAKVQTPLTWELLDADEAVVATGPTQVFGEDRSSGDLVHGIDFSAYAKPGEGYRLRVNDEVSYPFAIRDDLYEQLKHDAVHLFYHQRSGIPIEMPYAGDPKWERKAGHLSDEKVECLPELECNGTVNAVGGWYDAGDHGKYVVNAGLTVWALLGLYERSRALGKDEVFKDGALAIPEAGNGKNDLLDEARWELEWELRMQIPESAPKWQGLAFHKLHERNWSPVPFSPAEARAPRYLHRPSSAATLNLAANAAQCARIWKEIDPEFSARCLTAAERAWKAAQKHPALFAPGSDNVGGGAYDDSNVSDEFYWAAVELYLTTGNPAYAEYARSSKEFLAIPGNAQSAINWQMVQALGTISLAVVPGFDADTVKRARAAIVRVADAYVGNVKNEGYRTPLSAGDGNSYPWGSNGALATNLVVLTLAYDFTKDAKYIGAAVDALDYLLGRNAMVKSYVTGHGTNAVENPHHRFFAAQASSAYPPPPPGILSGGPNSALQDPYAQKVGLPGCPPQKCYVDHIESWSTNEIAINWNAPLAWGLTVLDEVAR